MAGGVFENSHIDVQIGVLWQQGQGPVKVVPRPIGIARLHLGVAVVHQAAPILGTFAGHIIPQGCVRIPYYISLVGAIAVRQDEASGTGG